MDTHTYKFMSVGTSLMNKKTDLLRTNQ